MLPLVLQLPLLPLLKALESTSRMLVPSSPQCLLLLLSLLLLLLREAAGRI